MQCQGLRHEVEVDTNMKLIGKKLTFNLYQYTTLAKKHNLEVFSLSPGLQVENLW